MNPFFRLIAALAATALVAVAMPAAAQQPSESHRAQASELLVSSGLQKSIQSLPLSITETLKRGLSVTRPEVVKAFDEVVVDLKSYFDETTREAFAIAVNSIAEKFSEAELKDINAFFKTPAGEKYARVFPDVLDAISSRVVEWGQRKEPEFIDRIRSEMKKRGHTI
jgi:hypothetical protein